MRILVLQKIIIANIAPDYQPSIDAVFAAWVDEAMGQNDTVKKDNEKIGTFLNKLE